MAKEMVFSFGIGASLGSTFAGSIGGAKKQINSLGATIRDLESKRVNLDTFKNLKFGIRDTEKQLASAQTRVNQLAGEMRRSEKPTAAMRSEFSKAKRHAQALTEKLTRQQTELHTLRGKMTSAGQATVGFKNQQVQLGAAIQKTTALQQKLNTISNKQAGLKAKRQDYQGQMVGAVGMAYVFTKPLKTAISFEEKMADIRKVVNFDGDADFKAMGKTILDMTLPGKGAIPMAADGLADIVAAAGQLGVAKNELATFAEGAAKMGVAFEMTGEEAGSVMGFWRKNMKLTHDETMNLGDAVNFLSMKMGHSAGGLAKIMGEIGASTEGFGFKDEIAAASLASAVFSASGDEAKSATTMMGIGRALTRGKAAAGRQKLAYSELGLDPVDIAERMQTDAKGTVLEVFKAIKAMPEAEQPAIASNLFGDEALRGGMALLGNLDRLELAFNSTADAGNYHNSMLDEFKIRSQTSANKLQLLGNSITKTSIDIGTTLLPALNAVAGVTSPVIVKVGDLATKFPWITQGIGVCVIGLVALKVATLAGGYAWTFLYGGVLTAQKALVIGRLAILGSTTAMQANSTMATVLKVRTIALAVAQRTFAIGSALASGALGILSTGFSVLGAAIMATPIGWIIGGVALLVGAAYLIYKYWEPIKGFFGGLWGGVVSVFQSSIVWIGGLLDGFNLFESGQKWIGSLVQGVLSMAEAPYNAIKGVLGKARNLLPFSDAKEGPLSQLTLSGQSIMGTIGAGIKSAAPGLQSTMSDALPGQAALSGGGRAAGGGGQSIQITISPTITLAPGMNAGEVRQAVDSSMQFSEARLREAVERMFAQNRRLSYA